MKKIIIKITLFLFLLTVFFCIPSTLDDGNSELYIYIHDWGNSGDESGEFNNPGGIFIYEDLLEINGITTKGSVFVTDTFNNRIQVFDLDGNFINSWGSQGTDNGEFNKPAGIYVSSIELNSKSSGGSVFVTDTFNSRVQVFDLDGNYIKSWGSQGTGSGELNYPSGIFVSSYVAVSKASGGSVFVTDTFNKRVSVFDLDGDYEGSFGEGILEEPTGIYIIVTADKNSRGSSGSVFVTDTFNKCVSVFDNTGTYLSSFGSDVLEEPTGIYIDINDNVFVADSGNSQIHVFNTEGEYIDSFSEQGSGEGQLDSPEDITGSSDGFIFVADTGNDRIQKFVENDTVEYQVIPTSNTTITVYEPIEITFNKPITTSQMSLSGSLINKSYDVSWESINYSNDRLIITPQTYWEESNDKTLNISYSLNGVDVDITITYDTENAVYVSNATGNNANAGTKLEPIQNINTAIDKLSSDGLTGNVYLAKGNYTVDYHNSTHIVMSEGISLYGGYSIGNWIRDIGTYPTIITDTSATGGSAGNPAAVIVTGSGITNVTIIDGITINGSSSGAAYTAGIFNDGGSPIISNNTIDGGTSATANTYGICNSSSTSAIIRNNHIDGGDGNLISYGIYNDTSPVNIYNNTIYGGDLSVSTYGIYNTSTDGAVVRNNTISGGSATTNSYGMYLSSSPNIYIDNNIIFTDAGTDRYGIYEADVSSDPSSIFNNDIFDATTALYMNEFVTPLTLIADVNSLSDTVYGANSNVNVDLVDGSNTYFVDEVSDWHLMDAVPPAVTQGGLDGSSSGESWGFNTDKDGVTRTGDTSTGWSMGAYEKDL